MPLTVQAKATAAGLISCDVCRVNCGQIACDHGSEPWLLRSTIGGGKAGLPMQMRL